MSWPTEPFGAVCRLVNGKVFTPSDWSDAGVPIIRIQNLNASNKPFNYWSGDLIKQVVVRTGDLLLAWSGTPGTSFGAHIWNGSDGVLNQHIFRCDLDTKLISRRWAQLAVNHRLHRLIQQAHGGVGLQHVTRDMVESLEIPLPPVAEQRRIATILYKADALRVKRRAALDQLDTLAQSIFLDMFGDPVMNPKGWKRVPFSELLYQIDSGWSPKCLDRTAAADEWGVLKLGAVTWCEYDETENKALPPQVSPKPELEVRAGDLLFSRKNTYELVAACALVRKTRPKLLLPDLVFRFHLKPDAPVVKVFLHQLLIYPTKRREVQKLAGGSAGSMPNISKGRLENLLIEMPPLPKQREFVDRLSAIEQARSAQRASLNELDDLFAALQHRAFRGDL